MRTGLVLYVSESLAEPLENRGKPDQTAVEKCYLPCRGEMLSALLFIQAFCPNILETFHSV